MARWGWVAAGIPSGRLASRRIATTLGPAVALALALAGCAEPAFADADAAAIEAVLAAQRDAWNAGDIDQFMTAYVPGPELVFTSGGAVRRGYDEALARYRAKYVDGGASAGHTMGQLAFTDLEVTGLSANAAVVLGRWAVRDTAQAGEGIFSLVLVRRADGWRILHDHTSLGPAATP